MEATSSSTLLETAAETVTSLLPPSRVARNLELHLAAEAGDIPLLRTLLSPSSPSSSDSDNDDGGVDVWYEDPSSAGWSALHFAAEGGHLEAVNLLLRHGALWNAVDAHGYTAAQVAWSMNHERCYQAIFDEGVRQTLLLNALQSQDDDEEMVETDGTAVTSADGTRMILKPSSRDVANDTEKYLSTKLRFVPDSLGQVRCLDEDNNMVMAPWETDIMRTTASLLCENQPEGFTVLNVGFGLGIIDTLIQTYEPKRHVIIEAHPDAIAYAKSLGFDKMEGVELFEGRWEDWVRDSDDEEAVQRMMELGSFDAVYWDTYSQDYKDVKKFFDALPNILNGPESRFSFFHGLAATNSFLYAVYTRIAELDLRSVGLTTTWHTLQPRIREEEWQGVKQKYWQLDEYWLPLCRFEDFS